MGIIIPPEIEALGDLYEIDLGAAAFVEERRYLISYLAEMAPVLTSYFPDGPLQLRLERDPESGRPDPVRVYALWAGDPNNWREAHERLDHFNATWGREKPPRLRAQVSVDFHCLERAK